MNAYTMYSYTLKRHCKRVRKTSGLKRGAPYKGCSFTVIWLWVNLDAYTMYSYRCKRHCKRVRKRIGQKRAAPYEGCRVYCAQWNGSELMRI